MRRVAFVVLALPCCASPVWACTTAVVSAKASPDGRPLLWKNRDADNLHNQVVFCADGKYAYLGIVNQGDVAANFGVADAKGGAAYFEAGPKGYKRYLDVQALSGPKGLLRALLALEAENLQRAQASLARWAEKGPTPEDAKKAQEKFAADTLKRLEELAQAGPKAAPLPKNGASAKK